MRRQELYRDKEFLWFSLDRLHAQTPIKAIITGGASGADHLAELWAIERRIPRMIFQPNWEEFGPAAGPIRNERMILEGKPDQVLAFAGGKGTADMIRQARRHEIPVWHGAREAPPLLSSTSSGRPPLPSDRKPPRPALRTP